MEVLEVLKQCKISGNVVTLPNIQLDRKIYLEVAKKIELIGGKWNRKEKGFLFKESPSELFNSICDGDNRNLKKEYQFFATPKELAQKLCSFIPKDTKTILEPSAGRGSIIQAVNEFNPDIKVSYCELMELNRKQLKGNAEFLQDDFLTLDENLKFDVVVANPPFSKNQDIEHFYKMVKHARKRVITIMSKHWHHSSFKKETEFKDFIYSNKAQIIEIDAGAFKESGTMISSCIVIFDIDKEEE